MYDKHLGVEFQSEVRTLAQVEHLNLVKCYGFLEHEEERILVVEYVPNGTLREQLDCEFFLLCVLAFDDMLKFFSFFLPIFFVMTSGLLMQV